MSKANIDVVDLVRNKPNVETVETKVQTVKSVTSSIWIPIPHDELPSNGFYYEDQLMGRPLGAMEIKQLSAMNQKNATIIVDQVIKSATTGVPFENVLLADKMYIVFWLRQNSYKRSDYNMSYECTECESNVTSKFTLSDLEIMHLQENTNFEVLVGDKKFVVKFRTVEDENETKKFLKKNSNTVITFDEDWLELASSIVSIDGKEMPLLRKYQYLTNPLEFGADDYAELTSGINNIAIGVKPTVKIKCPKCGGFSDALIPFRPDYFLPTNKVQ